MYAGALANSSYLKIGNQCVSKISGFDDYLRVLSCGATPKWKQLFMAGTGANQNRVESQQDINYCVEVQPPLPTLTPIKLTTCSTGDNQRWAVDSAGRLQPASAPGMCLDTSGGSQGYGVPVVINPCSGAISQQVAVVNVV